MALVAKQRTFRRRSMASLPVLPGLSPAEFPPQRVDLLVMH